MTQLRLMVVAALIALAVAACGGGSESSSAQSEPETTAQDAGGAPCTKEALAKGAQPSFGNEQIEILDGFVCEGGWAAGPVLIGPAGSEEQIEAAFIVEDKSGTWKVPASLPCDNSAVPAKVLDNSPCRVS